MAVFLFIGKNLKLPFSAVFALGKFGNLLMYVIVMFWAIRLAKSRKLLLAFVAMLPTPLFLASSYTYDSVVFSFITLGCVLWSREAFFQSTKYYHTASVIGAIFMMSVGCLSKAVYIPLVLLMLLLPQFDRNRSIIPGSYGNVCITGYFQYSVGEYCLWRRFTRRRYQRCKTAGIYGKTSAGKYSAYVRKYFPAGQFPKSG